MKKKMAYVMKMMINVVAWHGTLLSLLINLSLSLIFVTNNCMWLMRMWENGQANMYVCGKNNGQ